MLKKTVIYIAWIKIFFLFLGFSLLFLGWFISPDDQETSNEKIVFMLDVSNSMNIQDVFYNGNQVSRLDMSKIYIKEYINNGDNNIWLIIFAGKANLFIAPTKDKLSSITYLDTINSNSINWWWSNVYDALEKFINNTEEDAMGIILSDFGDSIDYQKQIDLLKSLNIKWRKIIPIWVGTSNWWLVVNSHNDLITDNGATITDKLNLAYLEKISSIVSQPYKIFDDEKEFKLWTKSKKMKFSEGDKISPKWLLIAWWFFVIIGL